MRRKMDLQEARVIQLVDDAGAVLAGVTDGPNKAKTTSPDPPRVRDAGALPVPTPPCVINWPEQIDRAEADLRQAVIVTVFGATIDITPEAVVEALVFKFEVDAASLRIRRSGAEEFIVLVADEATAARFARNDGPSSCSAPFRVHCRRWSRQAHATGAILPCLVDVELHGVPAHAWEVATAENLLNPYGWLKRIHPNTRNRLDYSAFKFSSWCYKLSDIPKSRDLVVVEPVDWDETPLVKRALVYPISFSVWAMDTVQGPPRPESPDDETEEETPQRQRRRRQRSPANPRADTSVPARRSRSRGPPRDLSRPINSGP